VFVINAVEPRVEVKPSWGAVLVYPDLSLALALGLPGKHKHGGQAWHGGEADPLKAPSQRIDACDDALLNAACILPDEALLREGALHDEGVARRWLPVRPSLVASQARRRRPAHRLGARGRAHGL